MQKTLDELQELRKAESAEQYRQEKSIEMGFCPVCGSKLIKVKKKRWFDFILDQWHERNYCSANQSHYDKSGVYFDASADAY